MCDCVANSAFGLIHRRRFALGTLTLARFRTRLQLSPLGFGFSDEIFRLRLFFGVALGFQLFGCKLLLLSAPVDDLPASPAFRLAKRSRQFTSLDFVSGRLPADTE